MHLSLLSDSYFSDSFDVSVVKETGAVAHRNGLLRGLAAMAIAGILLGLTALSTASHPAKADPARCASAAPQAAVWWESSDAFYRSDDAMRRSTSLAQAGTAVSLVALRQRFRSSCR